MAVDTGFAVRTEIADGVARIALEGELDMATVPVLEDHLAAFAQDGVSTVLVDVEALEFIDSTGLRALLQARTGARAAGHQLTVVGARPSIRQLFDLTGTEFLLQPDGN
jgi:anti-sigma B factor antagonist